MELESYAKAKQAREVRLVKRGSGKEMERVPQLEEIDGDLLKQFEAYIKALQCSRRGKRCTTARDKTPPNAT